MSKSPGITVMTEFCTWEDAAFTGYVSYLDREDAERQEPTQEGSLFSEYLDYQGKGIFTRDSDALTEEEKGQIKQLFQLAQSRHSLMWQTVISFDTDWLIEQGIYHKESGTLNEATLKSATRKGIQKMLDAEGLSHALWTAAIHYNTDHFHVHVATVEVQPIRERRSYPQYETIKVKGKWKYKLRENPNTGKKEKIPVLDAQGVPVVREETVGKFQAASIERCKSGVANALSQNREVTRNRNQLIWDLPRQILEGKKKHHLFQEPAFQKDLQQLYEKLPRNVNRNLWAYNANVMAPLREELDRISTRYLNTYQGESFRKLKEAIEERGSQYREAYGDTGRDYQKLEDLYQRLGNAILKELKHYDRQREEARKREVEIETEENIRFLAPPDTEEFFPEPEPELPEPEEQELSVEENAPEAALADTEPMGNTSDYSAAESVFIEWSKTYRNAQEYLYRSHPDYETGIALLEQLSESGNVLATYDLGGIYRFGRGREMDRTRSQAYYAKALKDFESLYLENRKDDPNQSKKQRQRRAFLCSYLPYRIGKQYLQGLGTSADPVKAAEWISIAAEQQNPYAQYTLGRMYLEGNGVRQDLAQARNLFERACLKNPYAQYQLAEMDRKGIGRPANPQLAAQEYPFALEGFLELEHKQKSDFLQYRIGMMYLRGQGTEVSEDTAQVWLKQAAKAGNPHAQYQLAKLYEKRETLEDTQKAIVLLEKSAEKGDLDLAQYALGKLYLEGMEELRDLEKAISWLNRAADKQNSYAQYTLGNVYLKEKYGCQDIEKACSYLEASAAQHNSYGQYALGTFYLKKEYGHQDIGKAIEYLEASAEQGNEYAQYALGKLYLEKAYGRQDIKKAVHYLEASAKQGNEYAQYMLGKLYMEEMYGRQDIEKAIGYLETSAEQGNEYAQYRIGKLYMEQRYGHQDIRKAIEYLEAAAAQNNEYAQHALGKLYMEETYECQDIEKAVRYLEASIEQGNEYAQYRLGKLYMEQRYGRQDIGKAIKYLEAAAVQNNAYAQYSLGKLYLEEIYGHQNREKAVGYLKASAAQDNHQAQYRLGRLYLDSRSPFFQPQKGIALLKRSAEQGNSNAMLTLGVVYLQGKWVPYQPETGERYFNEAIQAGHPFAQEMRNRLYRAQYRGYRVPGLAVILRQEWAYQQTAMRTACLYLQKSMQQEYEKWINQQDYQKLQNQIQYGSRNRTELQKEVE